MQRGYRYRIYPNAEQEVLMAKTFGCVRYVYNWGLNLKSKLWKEELVKDVLEIITVFSARLYDRRSNKNKKLLEDLDKVVKDNVE